MSATMAILAETSADDRTWAVVVVLCTTLVTVAIAAGKWLSARADRSSDQVAHARHSEIITTIGGIDGKIESVSSSVEKLDARVDAHQAALQAELRQLHKADADLRVELERRVGPIEHRLRRGEAGE